MNSFSGGRHGADVSIAGAESVEKSSEIEEKICVAVSFQSSSRSCADESALLTK